MVGHFQFKLTCFNGVSRKSENQSGIMKRIKFETWNVQRLDKKKQEMVNFRRMNT